MSPLDIAIVMLVSTVGFTLQGAVGFGMGILGTPILILLDTRLVPGPVLASTMLFTLALGLRERRAIDISGLRWAMIGRVVGTAPAAWVLAALPADQLSLVFGLVVLFGVSLSVSGLRVDPRPPALLVGGVLSGVMGTIAAVGGPPLALIYQHAPGAQVRGTLSGLFFFGTIVSLAALLMVGRFGWAELQFTLAMLPGALFGFVVSRRLATRLDRGYTRAGVLGVATIAGTVVVVRYFLGGV
ncbi:MAG: hypothetical protein CL483_11590 [Acidobacteria bacterium]|nr:hypothetical protein [Acidobacteriota bacterium]|tara:strand:+ start:115 stop:840 length:726 start_codon:yes stop_codon:yes gene_type:complete